MPIPGPFVHFQQVNIWRLLGKSTLKFLRDAKESFVGSAIHYSMIHILDNKDTRNQMHYLFQNVFHKPSHISVTCQGLSDLKVLTAGLPNCSRIKLEYWYGDAVYYGDADTVRIFLNWLSSSKKVVKNSQRDTVQKHLELDFFPRWFILELVQQVKDAFIDERSMLSDFLVTFVASRESEYCLEGDHKFTLNKISSNQRLSFFTHGNSACRDPAYGRAYRLWCRRVVNELDDLKMGIHLQNLGKSSRLGIDLYDREFYDFIYPYTFG